MNQKIIKRIIQGKLNAWIKTIEDEEVRKLVEKNTILTGGAITSLLLNEKPKDFDIYFKDKATTKAVAIYYVKKFNDAFPQTNAMVLDGADDINSKEYRQMGFAGNANLTPDRIKIAIASAGVASAQPQILGDNFEDAVDALNELDSAQVNPDKLPVEAGFKPVFLSSNAITLTDGIQIVVRFYGSPEEIHANYDFVHCTNVYDYSSKELVLKKEALECILAKELRYQGSKYPVCSVIRTRKFLKRGWHINAGQYLKMMFQISKLNLSNLDVLEDQLVGVDSAYFNMLISALRDQTKDKPDFEVDTQYITTIIDRLF